MTEPRQPKEQILGEQRPALRLVRSADPPRLELPAQEERAGAVTYVAGTIALVAFALLVYVVAAATGAYP